MRLPVSIRRPTTNCKKTQKRWREIISRLSRTCVLTLCYDHVVVILWQPIATVSIVTTPSGGRVFPGFHVRPNDGIAGSPSGRRHGVRIGRRLTVVIVTPIGIQLYVFVRHSCAGTTMCRDWIVGERQSMNILSPWNSYRLRKEMLYIQFK